MHLKTRKINLFIDTANATFSTLRIQSFATCFGRFWPPSCRLYNIHVENTEAVASHVQSKNVKMLPKPASYECSQSATSCRNTALNLGSF